ncbi:MAG: hypothetical protein ACXVLQ_08970 [Bacteriovorax sp.]
MDYQELYQETIEKLKRNERPLIKLTPELVEDLRTEWQKALEGATIDEASLEKILCILDNTQNTSQEFNECFFTTMEKLHDQLPDGDLLIYTLAASQKHVVAHALRTGIMIHGDYFLSLKKFLKSKNPEVLEWTLRTIESMGPLSLRFKNEVREAKPGFLKLFNQHQQAAFQIIELLEKQWQSMRF